MHKALLWAVGALLLTNVALSVVTLDVALTTHERVDNFSSVCEGQAALLGWGDAPAMHELSMVTSDPKVRQYVSSEEFRAVRYLLLKDACGMFHRPQSVYSTAMSQALSR